MDWIRQNRLPLFLESEVYMEYRLASLMAQVEEVVEDENELVTMKIDPLAKLEEIEEKKVMVGNDCHNDPHDNDHVYHHAYDHLLNSVYDLHLHLIFLVTY